MRTSKDCIFCKIVAGEIPAAKVYEDERALAFRDINPQAPTHALVIPRAHIASLNEAGESDEALLGHLLLVAARIAGEAGHAERGFRTVVNTNADAGQSVFHVHVHVLGGRTLTWPPG
jgi:histidine triad (HIT) family protein